MQKRVHITGAPGTAATPDVFEEYVPPFDLEADMLFALALAPGQSLSESFPHVPFARIGRFVPLLLWFARVRSLEHGPAGQRLCLDESHGFGYDEVNIVPITRGPAFFVPVIYAGPGLTQRLGHRYGMPKRVAAIEFEATGERVLSQMRLEAGITRVEATLLASGRLLALPFDLLAPWWTWRASFPDRSFIHALVQKIPRAQLAMVSGSLVLGEAWLPRAVRLFRLGLYVPGLRMRLPAPETAEQARRVRLAVG